MAPRPVCFETLLQYFSPFLHKSAQVELKMFVTDMVIKDRRIKRNEWYSGWDERGIEFEREKEKEKEGGGSTNDRMLVE